ncbi:MAG: flagellar biosynthesis protein FlhB [Vampirovibrionales bacterium]
MGDEDKNFEASAQKLRQLREQGQVIKSRDLSQGVLLTVVFTLLINLMPMIWDVLKQMFIAFFDLIPNKTIAQAGWPLLLMHAVKGLIIGCGPFLLVAALTAILADIGQVGVLFALKVIMPKFDKLNPINGIKGIFSKRTIIDLLKNLIKISILGYLAYGSFQKHLGEMLNSGQGDDPMVILFILGNILKDFIYLALGAFFVIGAFDYLYQRQKFLNDQKMSLKEVKDEYKQSEGDPMVKHMLKAKRMQLVMGRHLEAVPNADVIVTNPIHVAVALAYKPAEMESPKVIAKGAELFAEKIKDIAREHNIPIVENALVAQTLYKVVDLEMDIPPDLYQAVAEILLFAWKLQGKSLPQLQSEVP